MINPYADINWSSVLRIGSASHMHMTSQEALDNGYRHGIRHFPVSNYYPSAPYGANTRPSDFALRQHWPARRDNEILTPPINWNDVIAWKDELEEQYRQELPFQEGGLAFPEIPGDIIISPNSEHHHFSNGRGHFCALGSSFISGNIESANKYHLAERGYVVGFGGTWEECFDRILEKLEYPDAGGVIICHPTWFSHFTDDEVMKMLDYDERVLGIEIYNDLSANRDYKNGKYFAPDGELEPGFSLNMWDRILSTGRKCMGFCVPDHSVEKLKDWHGRSILLVPEFTGHNCLKAYRQGQFYGCLKDNGLTVTDYAMGDSSVSVRTNRAARIKFITKRGLAEEITGEVAEYHFPDDCVYVRVEIADDSGERLFLQPTYL